MAVFVLVHGAWHGGWCFDKAGDLLRRKGHAVLAPDLPGMNATETELREVTLERWTRFILDIARAQAEPVLLCGHSRAGSVISMAAEQAPELVRALVYICAFMLPDGDSPAAFKARQQAAGALAGSVSVVGENAGTKVDPGVARAAFYNTALPRDAAIASGRLMIEPFKPSRTPLALSGERYGRVKRHYVECTHDRIITLAEQKAMQRALPVATVETIDCDHSPFLSSPDEFVRSLLRISELD